MNSQRIENIAAAEEYLNRIPRFSKVKHDMSALRTMLRMLDAEFAEDKVVHVAGTNGKGSVCAFLTSILRSAGKTTATFTSPHLVSVRERFRFDGEMISETGFMDAFTAVHQAEEVFAGAGMTIPTYFEYLFLMFAVMCRKHPTDNIILETGLGGRLDATNCLQKPAACAITSISLDHMQYLGNTVTAIAGEKAGIIKEGVPFIYDNTDAEASAVFVRAAEEKHCRAYPVDPSMAEGLAVSGKGLRFTGMTKNAGRLSLHVPFPAAYQAVNAMIAAEAAGILGIPKEYIEEGISSTRWPGRMEEILPGVFLDGGHNEGGIRAFASAAAALPLPAEGGRKLLLFAVSSDKEYEKMLYLLRDIMNPDAVFLTRLKTERGLDTEILLQVARRVFGDTAEISVNSDAADAMREVLEKKKAEDLLFCAGSLYLIGEIKSAMQPCGEEKI
ncbi:MAG: bifunctional folylpolyglutamate synthase/dihydrofolate synthase [Clostridium sp.]|nr:bifunctional folylpolyglutamate synthase/dihydrofolate synthase [Clostridium sp.]